MIAISFLSVRYKIITYVIIVQMGEVLAFKEDGQSV